MRFLAGLVVVLGLFIAAPTSAQRALPDLFGGPFTLVDHDGRAVSERSFAGRHMLVYFGYTFCPDVCPTDLTAIAAALDEIGPLAGKLQPLFVTVDPARDTAEVMRRYALSLHPALLGLTGTEAQVAGAAKAYRVHRRIFKVEGGDEDDYLVDHSSLTYLMGPNGQFVTMVPHGTAPERIAALLRKYLTR
ncbi:MAG: SCO family protein [Proteobacteria bacterium]|nr:SCO family protein [Pseudomonadota bacterium]MDA1310126.1 SCO family protein [Pseudomonadota bacterium]